MALSRAVGVCRLALRTQWAVVRQLGSAASGDPLGDDEKRGRLVDLEALRRERAPRPPTERTQPAPPRKVFGVPRPTPEQLELNKNIGASASAEAVLDLATARPALLNGLNVCTALMKIAKLVGKGKPAQWLENDARFQQLLAAAVPSMERKEVDAYGFTNLIYACRQLDIVPPDSWLESFWRASGPKLCEFVPQGFSNTLYACGQLNVTPPHDWLGSYWHASTPKLCEFTEQALSNTLDINHRRQQVQQAACRRFGVSDAHGGATRQQTLVRARRAQH